MDCRSTFTVLHLLHRNGLSRHLYWRGTFTVLTVPHVLARNFHGTACTVFARIGAELSRYRMYCLCTDWRGTFTVPHVLSSHGLARHFYTARNGYVVHCAVVRHTRSRALRRTHYVLCIMHRHGTFPHGMSHAVECICVPNCTGRHGAALYGVLLDGTCTAQYDTWCLAGTVLRGAASQYTTLYGTAGPCTAKDGCMAALCADFVECRG
jgi:hypothetical protein